VLPASRAPDAGRRFAIERSTRAEGQVISAVGELDASAVPTLEEAIAGSVEVGRPLILDLSRLSFIDSCGLWAITTTFTSCRQRGVDLSLRPGPEQVQHVFEVTGLSDVLPFTDLSGEAAIE
jgi:anti-sigma B factor antagonist